VGWRPSRPGIGIHVLRACAPRLICVRKCSTTQKFELSHNLLALCFFDKQSDSPATRMFLTPCCRGLPHSARSRATVLLDGQKSRWYVSNLSTRPQYIRLDLCQTLVYKSSIQTTGEGRLCHARRCVVACVISRPAKFSVDSVIEPHDIGMPQWPRAPSGLSFSNAIGTNLLWTDLAGASLE
jgi:hypothetical protein